MLYYYFKEAGEESFRPLHHLEEGCWLHVNNATITDISTLSTVLDLDFLNLQDCLDKYEIPRIEKIGSYVFIFVRAPTDNESGLYTSTFSIIISPSYFITISPTPTLLVENFMSQHMHISTYDRSKLLIRLLLKLMQDYTTHIKKLRHEVLDHEKDMLNVDSEDISILTKQEDILNQYSSALASIRKVLESIATKKYTDLYQEEPELVDDLLNAVDQCEDTCINSLKSIRSLRDSYQIIFTNNLHKTIKLLTALTILFNIPTMVASIYGMNVSLPLGSNPHAFYFISLFTTGSLLISWVIFLRKRWL